MSPELINFPPLEKFHMKIYTDCFGCEGGTDDVRREKFIKDMNRAGIPWRWYSGRGMFGISCPAVVTTDEVSEEDIIRATSVRGLRHDEMGLALVIYTG